ncbi:hypothetical protein Kfla_2372 [Kribbella flavida DSM 17836]|uniref:Uncharacterized protein n=1 Tax=Kribbella flavida (strain DSM 17836 / JCM 10339 / NBRC 14399) TaxID=479435 RepID=D2PUY1_KRIFD|nr:hypothetical protein [Kribbella flavida]ADB31447.1 hypothetical protein Kfla_2372 [Kribbella flavida DSM 17836]
MAALDSLREHWRGVGTELIVRATRGICAGSLLNADRGRADTAARIEDWSGVLSLYAEQNAGEVRVSA